MMSAQNGKTIETRHFINNQVSYRPSLSIAVKTISHLYVFIKYVSSDNGDIITVRNPFDDSIVADFYVAGEKEVNDAVSAARKAFKSGPWSSFSGAQRARCMLKFADLLEERTDEFVHLDPMCMGIPVMLVKHVLIPACIETFRCVLFSVNGC